MRTPFIAGNWKMHLDRAGAIALASGIAKAELPAGVDVAVCPPSPYLSDVVQATAGSKVGVGGQNCHFEAQGAFTGEVATAMLVDVGCRYVILGHSERRQLFGETDAGVLAKAKAALGVGLIPIICVGETLEEREAGRTFEVVRGQCDGSIGGLTEAEAAKIVIAYEPVWAIGTGKVATPAQAEEVHSDLRTWLTSRYNASLASAVRIQYGGSVKPDNAVELLGQPNIDGALVGGAALKVDSFLAIVRAAVV
ncbi:MAG TPA: triose-phosphate isomerase [Pirellulaceae bacterium]|nr:triose-phosphate isomerase [Pirellulaceae bacterium]